MQSSEWLFSKQAKYNYILAVWALTFLWEQNSFRMDVWRPDYSHFLEHKLFQLGVKGHQSSRSGLRTFQRMHDYRWHTAPLSITADFKNTLKQINLLKTKMQGLCLCQPQSLCLASSAAERWMLSVHFSQSMVEAMSVWSCPADI